MSVRKKPPETAVTAEKQRTECPTTVERHQPWRKRRRNQLQKTQEEHAWSHQKLCMQTQKKEQPALKRVEGEARRQGSTKRTDQRDEQGRSRWSKSQEPYKLSNAEKDPQELGDYCRPRQKRRLQSRSRRNKPAKTERRNELLHKKKEKRREIWSKKPQSAHTLEGGSRVRR